eukprot:5530847-Pyramimonas_sp.AAC.1
MPPGFPRRPPTASRVSRGSLTRPRRPRGSNMERKAGGTLAQGHLQHPPRCREPTSLDALFPLPTSRS